MKQLVAWFSFLIVGIAAAAAQSFVEQLSAAERQAAGLDQLTAEQRATLDQLAARYASEGSRAEVAKVQEASRAEVAKMREETKAEVESEVRRRDIARKGLDRSDEEGVKSRIAGTFKGWSGRTLFPLENGQQWVQVDTSDRFWVSPTTGPDVEIRASGIGGWKLYLPSGRWVRVRRVN